VYLHRQTFRLSPAVPDLGERDSDEAAGPVLARPTQEKLAAGRQRAVAAAAAEYEAAIHASIAAARLSPSLAWGAMEGVFEARRTASRLLDGALRPVGLSEAEWHEARDAADAGASLLLGLEENAAWATRLGSAKEFLGKRITAEKAAGRRALAEEEHDFELSGALRGVAADGALLRRRMQRLQERE
jgi:hypothetical protein